MIRRALFLLVVFSLVAPGIAAGQSNKSDSRASDTIRYASLRADEVNVRAGPGVRYPVKWVFVRKSLPVAITADFESWRKIRDSEGAEGWVHRAMLSAKRSVVITKQTRPLRRRANDTAPAVARLKPGIVAEIESCDRTWCRVSVQSYTGWLRQAGLYGVRINEVIE